MAKGLVGIKVIGGQAIEREINKYLRFTTPLLTLEVGYDTPYAAKVHEDLNAFHPNGHAKYLQAAYEMNLGTYIGFVKYLWMKGIPFDKAMTEIAKLILMVSRKLVPVDTGQLRDSAYMRIVYKSGASRNYGFPSPLSNEMIITSANVSI